MSSQTLNLTSPGNGLEAPRPVETPSPTSDSMVVDLAKEYGPACYFNPNNKYAGINEPFWAALYARENTVLFEPDEKAFYRYDPSRGLFVPESQDAISVKLSARILEAARETGIQPLERERNANRLRAIITHLRGIVEHRDAFSNRPPAVHLANGMLVFHSTGEFVFHDFSPEYFSRNASPVAWDQEASCPRFLDELIHPAVHPEDEVLLQKLCGLYLLGRNLVQRFLILDGEAGRGKTQLANVIQGIIGRENCSELRTKFLADRFEIFRFLRKTLLTGVDVEPSFLSTNGASVIKGLVGGDWFDAEQKGASGSYPIQGNFNVIVTSNARLRVRLLGDLGAWRRRVAIIRFEAPPPRKKIPDFGALLVREEGSGILNWMLDGLKAVFQDMEQRDDLHLTERQQGLVDSLLAESDSLRHFLTDCFKIDPEKDVTVAELTEHYGSYCRAKGWIPLSTGVINGTLENLMLEKFGIAKSHSIPRCFKDQRGFRGGFIAL